MVVIVNIMIMISVNKYNEDFEHNEAPGEFSGHKWSLQTFWKYLEKEVFFFFFFITITIITIFIFIMIILIVIMLMIFIVVIISTNASNLWGGWKYLSWLFSTILLLPLLPLQLQFQNKNDDQGHNTSRIKTRINNLVTKTILCGHQDMLRSVNQKVFITKFQIESFPRMDRRQGPFSEWTIISQNGQIESSSAGEIWLQLLQTIWCGCLSGQVGLCQKIYLWWFVYWPKQNVQLTISIVSMWDS